MNGIEAISTWARNTESYVPADATKTDVHKALKCYMVLINNPGVDSTNPPTAFPWDASYWNGSPIVKRNLAMVGLLAAKLYDMEM